MGEVASAEQYSGLANIVELEIPQTRASRPWFIFFVQIAAANRDGVVEAFFGIYPLDLSRRRRSRKSERSMYNLQICAGMCDVSYTLPMKTQLKQNVNICILVLNRSCSWVFSYEKLHSKVIVRTNKVPEGPQHQQLEFSILPNNGHNRSACVSMITSIA